ncbi:MULTISPECIES: LCP family protein [unclassified Solwaraspora]|uniref:LCP family protein n=1 Tax=unclassified Solwaraspora TaxID=2627926 RepID=UPI00248B5BE3|nr:MULTISPECIES: LCP family protein [unclassified Solwaraspora]WBB96757.1 LCP family protein [Solwaraspora sp. WMMA2059]WBC19339.1 LCP family protein [Solwaraspora sp. WMMA2080]WJK33218.1 LCP family protein [Solwaraspora sp. WMMA2065]
MPVQTRRRSTSTESGNPLAARGSAGRRSSGRSGPGSGRSGSGRRPRRKDPIWARTMVVLGALLMMLSGTTIVGSKWLIAQATSGIEQSNLLGVAGKTDAEGGDSLEGPIDMLLLGIDHRGSWAESDTRADTIIILHIPATHDQAYLISVPRDTEVEIPPFDKSGWPGGVGKATEAFFHGAQNGAGHAGGAQLMAETIKNLTGVSFDGAAIINFSGFKSVIDSLGSVRLCVDEDTPSIHMTLVDGQPMWNSDAAKVSGEKQQVVHKKGCREMQGWEALDFSRQRYGLDNGDYDRQKNQQKLIKAMAKKAMASGVMTNPLKLNELIDAAGKAFVLDTGKVALPDFVFTLRGVAANDLVMLRTNGGSFNGNSAGRENIDPLSQDMFQAVKNDNLAEFILANPTVLAGQE